MSTPSEPNTQDNEQVRLSESASSNQNFQKLLTRNQIDPMLASILSKVSGKSILESKDNFDDSLHKTQKLGAFSPSVMHSIKSIIRKNLAAIDKALEPYNTVALQELMDQETIDVRVNLQPLEIKFSESERAFINAAQVGKLEETRIALWGRKGGVVNEFFEILKGQSAEIKREIGPFLNAISKGLENAFSSAKARVAEVGDGGPLDLTLPAPRPRPGAVHPLSRLGAEVERVFAELGFSVVDGPHVEHDLYNFTRLNIPADHPARDAQDTFWLTDGRCLRTHTSAVQSRIYEAVGRGRAELPLRQVVVGRVFRYEAVDATHDNTFTQVEGFVIDREITIAHMVGTIRAMLGSLLGRDDIEVRLRPAFYPFVEPGFDVDLRSPSAPREVRYHDWMELMGCGMVHPDVLRAAGIDAGRWNGFAFGLGLERLAMVRHGIADIRVFHGGDLRSLRQFAAG